MNSDDRMTPALILEILDVLERHGYQRRGHRHTGLAIVAIHDLAGVYEGTRDVPGTYVDRGPTMPRPEPRSTRAHADPNGVTLTVAEAITAVTALSVAVDDKRHRSRTAPIAPTRPAAPASPASKPPGHMTCLRSSCSATPRPLRTLPAASRPPPTRRPASDQPKRTGHRPEAAARRRDQSRILATAPDYVIVIDQLRDRTWDTGLSLAEALEIRSSTLREPEPDLEAEP